MLTLRITPNNNDIYISNENSMEFIDGATALAQDIRLQCLMLKGENVFNVNEGVDYIGTIFGSAFDPVMARASIINTILSFDEVYSIKSIELSVENETLHWNAEIRTVYGNIKTGDLYEKGN